MSKLVDNAIKDVEKAKHKEAIGGAFIPEYEVIDGIKIYYKTVSHAWVITDIAQRLADRSPHELGCIYAYVFMHNAEDVRNKIMQELNEWTIYQNALEFFVNNNIFPEDIEKFNISHFMTHPYEKKS